MSHGRLSVDWVKVLGIDPQKGSTFQRDDGTLTQMPLSLFRHFHKPVFINSFPRLQTASRVEQIEQAQQAKQVNELTRSYFICSDHSKLGAQSDGVRVRRLFSFFLRLSLSLRFTPLRSHRISFPLAFGSRSEAEQEEDHLLTRSTAKRVVTVLGRKQGAFLSRVTTRCDWITRY